MIYFPGEELVVNREHGMFNKGDKVKMVSYKLIRHDRITFTVNGSMLNAPRELDSRYVENKLITVGENKMVPLFGHVRVHFKNNITVPKDERYLYDDNDVTIFHKDLCNKVKFAKVVVLNGALCLQIDGCYVPFDLIDYIFEPDSYRDVRQNLTNISVYGNKDGSVDIGDYRLNPHDAKKILNVLIKHQEYFHDI